MLIDFPFLFYFFFLFYTIYVLGDISISGYSENRVYIKVMYVCMHVSPEKKKWPEQLPKRFVASVPQDAKY